MLWQFEALLNDTYGGRSVAAHYNRRTGVLNVGCAGESCGPLSYWTQYAFTFREAKDSSFHLSKARVLSSFGVHPIPVQIKGQYVACDRSEKRFLITYDLQAGLSLACLTGYRIR
jgi:hypothetical protein